MGRLTLQEDFALEDDLGPNAVFSRAVDYDAAGRILHDNTSTLRGTAHHVHNTTNHYTVEGTGAYLNGALAWSETDTLVNTIDASTPDTRTTYAYQWWDGALQGTVTFDADVDPAGSATYDTVTSYTYNSFAQLTGMTLDTSAADKTVAFRNSAEGQVLRRDETAAGSSLGPRQVNFLLGGKVLGKVSNNGTDNVDYLASTARRTAAVPATPGPFRGGAAAGTVHVDFGLDYDAINSFAQGADGGGYQVQAGDTLTGIALSLWGDAALWYKLAEANGLSLASPLQAGRTLTIPTGVQRTHHNASTLKPYDPAEAIGELSSSVAAPRAPKKNKCGTFGIILLAVVAVAVTIVTSGALAAASISAASGASVGLGAGIGAAFGGTIATGAAAGWGLTTIGLASVGAAGAAAGSVVSQAVGVATGIQEKFSWKGVALSALSAGVSAGLSAPGSLFGKLGLGGQNALAAGARGALGSAATQGIAVATGLQDKFSWAGVAAAGVGAGVGFKAGRILGAQGFDVTRSAANVAANALAGGARAIANAATYSAIEGTSFGDNVMRALPDAIGQTIGELLVAQVQGPSFARQNRQFLESLDLSDVEARKILGAIGGIHPDNLRKVANSGGSPTNNDVASFLVNTLDRWEDELLSGFRGGVSISDFRAFKRRIAFHLVSADSYKSDGAEHILPRGYDRIPQSQLDQWGLTSDLLADQASGFSSAVYFDPEGGAIVAFKGTEPTDIKDIITDIKQHAGLVADQYQYLADNLTRITSRLSAVVGPSISFTGHSLGGGLATAAGLRTGLSTFAIAPAPLHRNTLTMYGVTDAMIAGADIQYAAVLGEPLQGLGRNWAERDQTRGFISNLTLGSLEGKTFFFGNLIKSYPAALQEGGIVAPNYLSRFDPAASHSVIHNGLSSFYTGATALGLGSSPWFWDWNIYGD